MADPSSVAFADGPIEGVVRRTLSRHQDQRGWLVELFRNDELPAGSQPCMAYVSETLPGVVRGPHEHREQSDCFVFIGPGDLELFLWDARKGSSTHGNRQRLDGGATNPLLVIVPPGVVHAYRNSGDTPAWAFNAPNRLFAGVGRQSPVDEIRHENNAASPFRLDEDVI